MSYCPILSYQRDATATKYCMGIDCELADEAGECLIKQALQCYVSAERTRVAEENDRLCREIELAKTYWALKKDGIRSPIKLLSKDEEEIYTPPATVIIDDTPQIDGYDIPVVGGITYAHITPTEKYPHGGWYEDLINMQKEPE